MFVVSLYSYGDGDSDVGRGWSERLLLLLQLLFVVSLYSNGDDDSDVSAGWL